MKKKVLISVLLLTILSCNSDENSDSNPLNGRWYLKQITYITTTDQNIISGTGTLTDCKSDSYYQIDNESVTLKDFQSCEISNDYTGNYNSTINQIAIQNSNSTSTLYHIEIIGNQLKLENSYTTIVNNVPTTYQVIQYCER